MRCARWTRRVALAAWFLLIEEACSIEPETRSAPAGLRVEVVGCHERVEGEVCELKRARRLVLLISEPLEATPSFRVSVTGSEPSPVIAREGRATTQGIRYELELPPDARRLTVTSSGSSPRRWTLPLAERHVTSVVDEATALKQRRPARALSLLRAALATARGRDRFEILYEIAKITAKQRPGEALSVMREAYELGVELGLQIRSATAARRGQHIARTLRDAEEIQRWTERLVDAPGGDLVVAFEREWELGVTAYERYELVEAEWRLQQALDIARALGDSERAFDAGDMLMLNLARLGRADAARRVAEQLEQPPKRECSRLARHATNRAWTALLAGRSDARDEVIVALEESLERREAGERCGGRKEIANDRLNLALALLTLRGDVVAAQRELAAIERQWLDEEGRAWQQDLEAQLALREGALEDAGARYRALDRLAERRGDRALRWRAQAGLARLSEARGDAVTALRHFERADELLEELLEGLATSPAGPQPELVDGDARASAARVDPRELYEPLLLVRHDVAQDHIGLLVREGRLADAMCRVRLERLRKLWSVDHVAARSHAADSAYTDLRASYWELRLQRAALLASRADLSLDEVARVDDELRELNAELSAVRRELARLPSSREGRARCEDLAAPPPGVALVVLHEGRSTTIAFVDAGRGVQAFELGLASPEADREALGAALLEPISGALAGASKVLVIADGVLRDIPFHALPVRGRALAAIQPVAYKLDLPPRPTASSDGAAVVAINPGGTLYYAEQRERPALRDALQRAPWRVRWLDRESADISALRSALPGAPLFHFAGHGVHARGGWRSSLELGLGDSLEVDDILLLAGAPEVVVLSACSVGKTDSDGGMSVARAFLARGSTAVIAPVEPVEDARAAALAGALYQDIPTTDGRVDAAIALARAQAEAPEMMIYRVFEP
ncbi:MAG: CHAT domain-containing protein [Myxococcales bacterium]|nr:CHAT domain-containing protein [Myxococcales bacterium]